MALEASHMRFALDARDSFEVEDESKYLSGSIYPDSRYMTGIDRTLTHDDSQMRKKFWEGNDFRKGWASHILYDKIQFTVHNKWFREIFKSGNSEMTSEDDWIVRTALKVLQDIDDLNKFDIKQYLNALNHREAPNGEDEAKIQEYNQLLIDLYGRASGVSIENWEQVWVEWDIPSHTIIKIRNKAYEVRKNEQFTSLVPNIYNETLKHRDEFFNKHCL